MTLLSRQSGPHGYHHQQPCNNLGNLHESSATLCQDFNTPMLSRNASVNRLEKDNEMKIAQNKEINDQLMEIRKSLIKSTC